MGSPMKKRRAWSTLDDEADAQESAALAASLAAAKDTAARSGALLSSAKEDLTDHQRWLQAQSAAVERDRDRHERWLQRQKDLRLANTKKDRIRRHRRLVRLRALQAIRQAFVDLFVFVRSWIAFGAGKVTSAVRFVGRIIGDAAAAVWRVIASAFQHAAQAASALAAVVARATASVWQGVAERALWTGQKIGSLARGARAGVMAGAAWGGSQASASVRAGSQLLTAGSEVVAQRAGAMSRTAENAINTGGRAVGNGGRALGSGLASTSHSAQALALATRDTVTSGASAGIAKAAKLGASAGRRIFRASNWVTSRLAAAPSKVFIHVARLGHEVQHFARVRAPVPTSAQLPPEDDERSSLSAADFEADVSEPDEPTIGNERHTASVHIFETYGPHPDGATLFGQPANDPWSAEPSPLAGPDRGDAQEAATTVAKGGSLAPHKLAGFVSDFPTRISEAMRASGKGVYEQARALGRTVRGSAHASWAWMRRQTARSLASAQASAGVIVRAQERAFAQGADWARKRGLDLSHMMIIAGAVLLLLGGLLIGGGFLMRSASDPVIAKGPSEETFSKLSWTFDEPERSLAERAIFTLSGTPESFLLNGISINGTNISDDTLTNLEAALSPDVQRPDLKLNVAVTPQDEQAASPVSVATVPPGAAFRLTFQFPPEALGSGEGISIDEFFEAYGGLLLRVRFEADGAERTVLQHLSPEMLKAQLEEVAAQAGGS